jgi:hypothetical protein
MARNHQPHLDTTQHLLVYALEMHLVPRKTAIRLVRQYSEAHILRQLCYYNYQCALRPPDAYGGWRWLVDRIRLQMRAPSGYPFPNSD